MRTAPQGTSRIPLRCIRATALVSQDKGAGSRLSPGWREKKGCPRGTQGGFTYYRSPILS